MLDSQLSHSTAHRSSAQILSSSYIRSEHRRCTKKSSDVKTLYNSSSITYHTNALSPLKAYFVTLTNFLKQAHQKSMD